MGINAVRWFIGFAIGALWAGSFAQHLHPWQRQGLPTTRLALAGHLEQIQATAIGVITGAAWAAQVVPLKHWFKVLNVGLLLGLLLPLMALVNDWDWAVLLSVGLGAAGGFFVVPMNAMLQHRGVQLLSAGRSISVQNVNENASILVMMGIYSSLIHAQLDVNTLACLLGGLVAVGMGLMRWRYQRLLRLGLMR